MADPQAARRTAGDDFRNLMRAAVLLALVLGGCGATPQAAVMNETDPAITDALNDPIMADPRLELQHGGGSVSVPVGIDGGIHAMTLGQIVRIIVRDPGFAGCNTKIAYAFAWMARLPPELALPAIAKVSEAAGNDMDKCSLRIIRYDISKDISAVQSFYRTKGKAAGYSVSEMDDGSVSGIRAKDGAAFRALVEASQTGTSVDFVTNRGA